MRGRGCRTGPLEGLGWTELGLAGHEVGHLDLSQLDLEATKVGLGKVLDHVLATTCGFLHQQSHCLCIEKEEERKKEKRLNGGR